MQTSISGTGTGVAPVVNLTFPFLDRAHVFASVNGTTVTFSWTGTTQVTFSAAVASGASWMVYRKTPTAPLVDFVNGAVLREADLDKANTQHQYIEEELNDRTESVTSAAASAAAAAASATSASTSATSAAGSATSATASAASATASAASATSSAGAASTSATNAATSASSATTSAASAATSATAAATSASSASSQVALAQKRDYLDGLRAAGQTNKRALLVVLIGQSLNEARGTTVRAKSWPGAYMFFGGVGTSNWKHRILSSTAACHYDSVASLLPFQEGVGERSLAVQSPCVGIAAALGGSMWEQAVLVTVAIGARPIETLSYGGAAIHVQAALKRGVKLLRAQGYEPDIAFYSAHGEANAAAGTTEADYYTRATHYYQWCQLSASQALMKPDYKAPVFITYPVQHSNNTGINDRIINAAIRRIARDLPGAVDLGAIYQWPMTADLTHPTDASFVLRGERVGLAIRRWFERLERYGEKVEMIDVVLNGTSVTIYFNRPVTRDTSTGDATALPGTDGFEWSDNGTAIAFSGALTYSGYTVTGTLASAPVGALSTQALRYGEQTTGATGAVPANVPGGNVRENATGVPSITDPTVVNYLWASPQTYTQIRNP